MNFISVGYGNIINIDRLIAIMSSNSAPARRLITEARANGLCIDTTMGRRTKAILVMDSAHVIMSALHVATLSQRIQAVNNGTPQDIADEKFDEAPDDGDEEGEDD
ncbi:MAG: DUF370 domain-containing protein [Clostridia bacterium]|jgi:regulator of extracellular matrix RemA (YlzA/DUF370 family)|nr:DUF370 domain-containing protein [Clostridia bacterium]MBO7503978.1 DUF370 domain-containing protein [Clostridia bacterium]MBP5766134.1 DUF370 domain-containing protein [Clostridia bacterium]MBR5006387.1 DUF370 domain-containing protein [Clostridia bacterium]